MKKAKSKHKILKSFLLVFLLLIVVLVGGFLFWANDYYHAENVVIETLQGSNNIKVEGNLTILSPSIQSDTALIFYPGAKVEAIAYLPILEKIKQECGITCILVEMPLNMAIFNSDAADEIISEFPDIKNWYIGGHSLGGVMASNYASKNIDNIKGLILMGAYVYGDYPPDKSLTIYGSFNDNLEKNIDYTDNIIKIEGGNHAQFGNYGKQKGDKDATITAGEQQDIAVTAIKKFLLQMSK